MPLSYSFRTAPINGYGSVSPAQQAYFAGLNDSLQLVGNYAADSSDTTAVAFVYSSAAPGGYVQVASSFASAYATGINQQGDIVGIGETTVNGDWHGFLSASGVISAIDFPGAASTSPAAVNDEGVIVGDYTDQNGVVHGFSYNAGSWTTIDAPAADLSDINITGVNDANQIVGYVYNDDTQAIQSFIDVNNSFTMLPDPTGAGLVIANGINNNGLIAGFYSDPQGLHHGFTYQNGHYRTVDDPGASDTYIYGVNDHGDVVGEAYFASTDSYSQFVALAQQWRASSFNGDTVTDLLWRNDNGEIALWTNNGTGGFSGQDLGNVDPSWKIAATADFNGDGASDILWRNTAGLTVVWTADGVGGFTSQSLGVVDPAWQVAGIGDLNGDGASDIVWRNGAGQTEVWNSNGSGGFAGKALGVIDPAWSIAAIGDINGDGYADILWRNAAGQTEVWNSDGAGGFAGQSLGVVGTDWKVMA